MSSSAHLSPPTVRMEKCMTICNATGLCRWPSFPNNAPFCPVIKINDRYTFLHNYIAASLDPCNYAYITRGCSTWKRFPLAPGSLSKWLHFCLLNTEGHSLDTSTTQTKECKAFCLDKMEGAWWSWLLPLIWERFTEMMQKMLSKQQGIHSVWDFVDSEDQCSHGAYFCNFHGDWSSMVYA